MNVNELRIKRAKAWEGTKAFLESHRTEKGVLTAEDDQTYNRMMNDINDYGKEIKRLEQQESFETELNKAVSTPIVNKPMRRGEGKSGRGTNEYKQDFKNALRGRRLTYNVLQEGVDADGGYLVPEEYETQILAGLQEINVVRGLAKVITTSSDHQIPVADTRSAATWTAENAEATESNPSFTQRYLNAHKLTDLVKITTELLQDNTFDLENYITTEFINAFAVAEEEAFCVGTGIGQPTGIFTAGGGSANIVTTSANITVDNLLDLIYGLKSPYRKNAKFLMKDVTVSAIRKLKDNNGAYLWQPSVQAGEPDKLLGYDLYTSAYVPDVAAGSLPVAFGDFSNYWIADRLGRTVQRLNELYSTKGQIGYLATERVDGKVILPEAIQLLKMKGE